MEILRKIIATFTRLLITAACVAAIGGVFSNSGWSVLWMVVPILVLLFVLYKKRMAWRFIIGFYSLCFMIPLYIFSAMSKEWHTCFLWGGIFFTTTFFCSIPYNKNSDNAEEKLTDTISKNLLDTKTNRDPELTRGKKIASAIFVLAIIAIIICLFISKKPLFHSWCIALGAITCFGITLYVCKDSEEDFEIGTGVLLIDSIPVFITALVSGGVLQIPLVIAAIFAFIFCLKIIWSSPSENDKGENEKELQKIRTELVSKLTEFQLSKELPEENGPDVAESQLTVDGHLVLPMCIAWLAQRRRKHNLSQEKWNKIRADLIHIKQRMTESTLYLGVIGDASVGKSTFINALLGFEFLKENVTLGTTSTATVIKKGDFFAIKVNFNDNKPSVTYTCKDLNLPTENSFKEYSPEIAQTIAKFTAIEKEEDASAIRSVEIYLPIKNELLESNVAIVDTPGLHSGNAWHDAATTNAVKNICDIALILTSAKTPLPKNFIDYLKSNLSSVLPRSILVMTQADTLDEDEREDQLDYIHSRLKAEVKTDVAACYGVSAYYSLTRENLHKHSEEEVSHFQKEFLNMTHDLKNYLQKGHETALFESLQSLIQKNLLPVTEKVLFDKKETLQKRKDELKKNELTHLDSFIDKHTTELIQKIEQVNFSEEIVKHTLEMVASDFENKAFARISRADSKDELKSAMSESNIKQDVEALMPLLATGVNKLCTPLKAMSKEGIDDFSAQFREAYARLQNLSNLSVSNIKIASIAVRIDSLDLPTNYFTNALEEQNNADNAKVGGGAAGGAAIGFLIGGPLGALVGGLGGAILGALFGKSLDTLKTEARGTVRQISNLWQEKMFPSVIQACSQNKENCKIFANNAIKKYVDTYGAQINAIISAEQKEQMNLENDINKIEQDVKTLIQLGGQNNGQ